MDAKSAYESRRQMQILDVREPFEWKMGHIEGARHIPMSEVPTRLDEIDRDTSLLAICRSGNRSARVTEFLRNKGFVVENVDGGMKAWAMAGLPVVSPKGKAGRVV